MIIKPTIASDEDVQDEITYTNENGNDAKLSLTKLDNIAKLPTTNKYETAIKESKIYSSASSILDNTNLTTDQQRLALKRLGVDPSKASYYQIANDDTNKKTMFVLDAVNKVKTGGGGVTDIIQLIANQRTQVNGQMIASNAVLDNLVDEGVLTKSQATEIKKYKFEEGKLTPIKKSSGKKIKIKAPKKISIKKLPRMKVYQPKPIKLKFRKTKPIKLKMPKLKFKKVA